MILSGLRKLQDSLADAASRSRVTPSVIVALSGVRSRFDGLMATAVNGVGLRKDLIEGVEAEESVLEDEASRIKDLIAALGG